jgi:hypothetical protein
MHRTSVLSCLVFVLSASRAEPASMWTQLNPDNIGKQRLSFAIVAENTNGNVQFKVTVEPKEAAISSFLEGHLSVFDGKEEIAVCDLKEDRSRKSVAYAFKVSRQYLAKSKFTFGNMAESNGRPMPAGDFYWFYLQDFVSEQNSKKAQHGIATSRANPAIKVIVATPESDTWALDDEHSHLDVIVENIGTTPIKVYDSWNSWGWDNLKLEWTANGKTGVVTHAARGRGKNFPSTTPLPPGAATIRSVSLQKEWEGWPTLTSDMKLAVRAIYESKLSEYAWQVKAISAPITVDINDRRKR